MNHLLLTHCTFTILIEKKIVHKTSNDDNKHDSDNLTMGEGLRIIIGDVTHMHVTSVGLVFHGVIKVARTLVIARRKFRFKIKRWECLDRLCFHYKDSNTAKL